MQYFKGDATEKKFVGSVLPLLDSLSFQKDLFYEGAFQAKPLADIIYDSKLAPLTNAILKSIFRDSFTEIIQSFIDVGTFEAYITVFKKIFGDDVEIEFTVSAPGKLAIDITATGLELSNFVSRYIASEEYLFDEVVDRSDGDNILFQTVKGFQTQYELEQMLFEMVPAGIFTSITLSVG